MNKYITVAYVLESVDDAGHRHVEEEATEEHPYQFISGMGVALEAFEKKIEPLAEGESFDFTLSVDEGYGPYDLEHVVELDKKMFCVEGRFNTETFFPGAIIPLVNADGMRFIGHILEISDEKVKIDLNDTLAGKQLHFTGKVITSRPATEKEIENLVNLLSGEDCGCGCGCDHEGEGEGCCHGHGEHKHCHHEHGDHGEGHCHCHHHHE